nr:MAG TPA: hypothetical protein [Caudoviricetes sp.]
MSLVGLDSYTHPIRCLYHSVTLMTIINKNNSG